MKGLGVLLGFGGAHGAWRVKGLGCLGPPGWAGGSGGGGVRGGLGRGGVIPAAIWVRWVIFTRRAATLGLNRPVGTGGAHSVSFAYICIGTAWGAASHPLSPGEASTGPGVEEEKEEGGALSQGPERSRGAPAPSPAPQLQVPARCSPGTTELITGTAGAGVGIYSAGEGATGPDPSSVGKMGGRGGGGDRSIAPPPCPDPTGWSPRG